MVNSTYASNPHISDICVQAQIPELSWRKIALMRQIFTVEHSLDCVQHTPPTIRKDGTNWTSGGTQVKYAFQIYTALVDRYRFLGMVGTGYLHK